jgi:hypothetical protein
VRQAVRAGKDARDYDCFPSLGSGNGTMGRLGPEEDETTYKDNESQLNPESHDDPPGSEYKLIRVSPPREGEAI